jgi:hypothetical protein
MVGLDLRVRTNTLTGYCIPTCTHTAYSQDLKVPQAAPPQVDKIEPKTISDIYNYKTTNIVIMLK